MTRNWVFGLLLAAAILSGCQRPDDELAANPELVDLDRDQPASAPAVTAVPPTPVKRTPVSANREVASISTPLGQQKLRPTSQSVTGPIGEPTSGLILNDDRAAPGFTLMTIFKERRAFLLDESGARVHVWHDPEARQWASSLLLPDGDLLVVGAMPGNRRRGVPDSDRYVERLSWQSEQRWRMEIPAHDDIMQRSDGLFSVLVYEERVDRDVHDEASIRDDVVVVFDANGKQIERHALHDAVNASDLQVLPQGARPTANGAGWVNLYNAKSLDWGTVTDDEAALNRTDCVLLTLANQDLVVVVDTKAGKVIWSWGRDEIQSPTTARFLANGNVLVFDNGIPKNRSRVLEVEPSSGEIVWAYESDGGRIFFSATRGMGQRLPNGNTLITSTDQGEVLEVTPGGETVWRFLTLANRMNKRKPIAAALRMNADWIGALLEKFGPDEPATEEEPEAEMDPTEADDNDD